MNRLLRRIKLQIYEYPDTNVHVLLVHIGSVYEMPTLVEITTKSGQKRRVSIPDEGMFDMVLFSVPVGDAIATLEKFGFEPKVLWSTTTR